MRDFFQVLYKPLPNVSYIYIDFIAGLLEGQAEQTEFLLKVFYYRCQADLWQLASPTRTGSGPGSVLGLKGAKQNPSCPAWAKTQEGSYSDVQEGI